MFVYKTNEKESLDLINYNYFYCDLKNKKIFFLNFFIKQNIY